MNFYIFLIEAFYIFFVCSILIYFSFRAAKGGYTYNDYILQLRLLILSLLWQFFLLCFVYHMLSEDITYLMIGNDHPLYVLDAQGIVIKMFICVLGVFIYGSWMQFNRYEDKIEFFTPSFMAFCFYGAMLLPCCRDLLLIYISLEIQSLALYILIVLGNKASKLATEAGLKYFIFGSFASAMILYGMSLVYGFTGSVNLEFIYHYLFLCDFVHDVPSSLIFGFALIIFGFFVKLGLAPFHYWVSDVYNGTSTISLFFLSTIPKISLISVLTYISVYMFSSFYSLWVSIILCCCCSIAFGSISAMYQTTMKRMLAYSSVANLGYILLGLYSQSHLGLAAAYYYLFYYSLSMALVFSILIALRNFSTYNEFKNLTEFAGIYHCNKKIAFILAFALLSLSGIPPFPGFLAKFSVITVLFAENYIMLVIFTLVFSVITSVYYLRLIRMILFTDISKDNPIIGLANISRNHKLLISILAVLNFLSILYQGPVWLFFVTIFGNGLIL